MTRQKALQAWFNCCFTSTETVGLLGDGGAQDVHLDFHTQHLPELCSKDIDRIGVIQLTACVCLCSPLQKQRSKQNRAIDGLWCRTHSSLGALFELRVHPTFPFPATAS